MSNTIHYDATWDDCDFPIRITWEVSYIMQSSGIAIVDHDILNAEVAAFPGVFYPLPMALRDLYGADLLNWRFWRKLDLELVRDACLSHWERKGKYLDDEGRRVA